MSIFCHEDGANLLVADQAYCVTTEAADRYTAICVQHFSLIPWDSIKTERLKDGLDIHNLFSRPNGYSKDYSLDSLSLRSAEIGDYRFSVPSDIARLILPKCSELYLEE